MTTTTADTAVLTAIRALTAEIAERAAEIEEGGVVPSDLLDRISDAGAFRMFVARRFGGEELSLPAALAVLEEIARADASTAWTVMIGADFGLVFGRFPGDVLDAEIYRDGPNAMARGAFAPKGVAVPEDGGYRVSGQWPLASGSYTHQWVMGNCIVLKDGQPTMTGLGVPDTRLVVVPAGEATFVSTWDSVGLRGTNSNDVVLNDVFVPERHATQFYGPPSVDAPVFTLPVQVALAPTHAAVVLGIAEGALEDLRAIAKTKRPAFNPGMRVAEDPVFQYRLGLLQTRLATVRALIEREVNVIWEAALTGASITDIAGARVRAMVAWSHTECVEIVNSAFGLAGSNAMYRSSSLQRRLRDVRTAAQHVSATAEIYQILGALLTGQDVPPAARI
ncbi:acyl-CoA dehydrogenase family protein [Mycolicibacterium sphagni]|uniref:acyl-CoA dehydrogenase family protein n=1 Tax=Mycolicibacterium sphagni TaxID=1786 RepID=UPI0021F38F02|nr:acyl-CoA dehydrogenase family protein [Mycolicibacterium sphagni]MCV7177075.1 acyl-CoA dehydrogenase family protein [Mycolicibacterium sphagni]